MVGPRSILLHIEKLDIEINLITHLSNRKVSGYTGSISSTYCRWTNQLRRLFTL
jgi:hypothetical protein